MRFLTSKLEVFFLSSGDFRDFSIFFTEDEHRGSKFSGPKFNGEFDYGFDSVSSVMVVQGTNGGAIMNTHDETNAG